MNIREKIWLGCEGLYTHGAINIVVLGDSVSHGEMNGYFDQEAAYGNRLRHRLNKLRGYMPINLINAAISGATAKRSIDRLERDVLSHHPDLIVICFGLNDVNGTLEDYIDSKSVPGYIHMFFRKCRAALGTAATVPARAVDKAKATARKMKEKRLAKKTASEEAVVDAPIAAEAEAE